MQRKVNGLFTETNQNRIKETETYVHEINKLHIDTGRTVNAMDSMTLSPARLFGRV
jgi:hypothetical protein